MRQYAFWSSCLNLRLCKYSTNIYINIYINIYKRKIDKYNNMGCNIKNIVKMHKNIVVNFAIIYKNTIYINKIIEYLYKRFILNL